TGYLWMKKTTNNTIGVLFKNDKRFIHDFAPAGVSGGNTFLGTDAGSFSMSGSGSSPMSPSVVRKVIGSFHRKSGEAKTSSLLSERETEILQLLADGKSYASIAKMIFLSVDGVGYHVRHIYEKLHVNSRGEAVKVGMKRRLIKLFR
ncbi:MAG: LuxR C-terminal-related transcriptional regulator, partial [Bacteroidota bacterium]